MFPLVRGESVKGAGRTLRDKSLETPGVSCQRFLSGGESIGGDSRSSYSLGSIGADMAATSYRDEAGWEC